MPLPLRKIGDTLVNPVGFGTMGLSFFYGEIGSDEERFKILDAAYEKGCRHWDSANAYGDSEDLIGKWFKRTGKRADIFITSKFGFTPTVPRGDPEYVREQCERSLQRLGVECIDLYYQHRPDLKTPIEVTVRAMVELLKEGKIKYIGLSEVTANDLRRAYAIHPITALQIEYSPFVLDIEDPQVDLLRTARELGVTIVAYSPLGRGILTGQYTSLDGFAADDFRRTIPKYSNENFPRILEIVRRLQELGKKYNATAGQVTLAWILAQGDDFVVIPGTKKMKYLEENIGAENVKLSPEDVEAVRKIAEDANKLPGTRYSARGMSIVLQDTPPLR